MSIIRVHAATVASKSILRNNLKRKSFQNFMRSAKTKSLLLHSVPTDTTNLKALEKCR